MNQSVVVLHYPLRCFIGGKGGSQSPGKAVSQTGCPAAEINPNRRATAKDVRYMGCKQLHTPQAASQPDGIKLEVQT